MALAVDELLAPGPRTQKAAEVSALLRRAAGETPVGGVLACSGMMLPYSAVYPLTKAICHVLELILKHCGPDSAVTVWTRSGMSGILDLRDSANAGGEEKMRTHLVVSSGLIACGVLISAPSLAGPYRDKHGNVAQLALTTPLVGSPLNGGIHFTIPYVANDSDGGKTGRYTITSQTSPGRGTTNDFVLSILVTDDRTQKGAELVIRSHPTTAPLAPVLRLLDCRTLLCAEDKRIENPQWGAFVIQNQPDISAYPIELLDAHASLQLLDSAILDLIPNTTQGTGNWAEIMQHHRTLLTEAKFRGDIEFLGEDPPIPWTG